MSPFPARLLRKVRQLRMNVRYALPARKPLVWLRIARGVAWSLLGRRPLRYVDFALDFVCNQHCQHCFATTYDRGPGGGRGHLGKEDYHRIAREAMTLGCVSFSVQGGEPFAAYARLKEVLSCLPRRRALLSVKSNGTLITPERAREIRALGVDIVTISLDSGVPEEHDAFRGMRGAYGKALRGAESCREAGIGVILACTLSRGCAGSEGVDRLIRLSADMDVILLFILAAPVGQWGGNPDVLLSKADRSWLAETLERHPHCRTDLDANFIRHGCGALKEIVYIDQYGNVMACPFIPATFGNVLDRPLAEIRERGLSIPELAGYAPQCLIAEEGPFLSRYLAASAGRGDLPFPASELAGGAPPKPLASPGP